MRWDSLFQDLESQLQAQLEAQFRDEVAENIRIERATEDLADKLRTIAVRPLTLHLAGSVEVAGIPGPIGDDYLCLEADTSSLLIRLKAIQRISLPAHGQRPAAQAPASTSVGLTALLRGLLRDRSRMRLFGEQGKLLTEGTPTQIGNDFLMIAAHPRDEFARPSSITEHSIIPLAAIGWLAIPQGS